MLFAPEMPAHLAEACQPTRFMAVHPLVPGCSAPTRPPPTLAKVLTAQIMPGNLKMVWGWCVCPVEGKLAKCCVPVRRQEQIEGLGSGLACALLADDWLPSAPWRRTKMVCGLWADKLALHTDRRLPGSQEQMSVKQLAKLPRAAPGQTDARLPHGSACGGCSALRWGSPSCSLPLLPAPSWLLLHPGLPAGARAACSRRVALSCQLETGAERGGGQAQPPRQPSPQTAAITGCLHPD